MCKFSCKDYLLQLQQHLEASQSWGGRQDQWRAVCSPPRPITGQQDLCPDCLGFMFEVTVLGSAVARVSHGCWPSGPFCRGFVDPHCSTTDQMIPCHVVESTYLNQSAIVIDYTSLEAKFHIGDILMVVLVSYSVMSISCLHAVLREPSLWSESDLLFHEVNMLVILLRP